MNAIIEDESSDLLTDVRDLKTPLSFVKAKLMKRGFFLGCGELCMDCATCSDGCEQLVEGIQSLMTEGILQFSRRAESGSGEVVLKQDDEVATITIPRRTITISAPIPPIITITKAGPIPFESTNAVPWHYGAEVYCNGQKLELEPFGSTVENLAGISLDVYKRQPGKSGRIS